MEETIYNAKGKPEAYIDYTDEDTIYLWDGTPIAYLNKDSIYGFNGKHLGWYEDGIMRDHSGNIVGFNKKAANVFVAFEPFKAFKKFKPFKSFEAFAPFKPFYHSTLSEFELIAFLLQGKK